MKIYVVFRTDTEETERTANGSLTKLKGYMKGTHNALGEPLKKPVDKTGAEYTVVLYEFKPNLTNVCQAVMDVTELDALKSWEFRINNIGQLREIK
jgi:hypothetical protein